MAEVIVFGLPLIGFYFCSDAAKIGHPIFTKMYFILMWCYFVFFGFGTVIFFFKMFHEGFGDGETDVVTAVVSFLVTYAGALSSGYIVLFHSFDLENDGYIPFGVRWVAKWRDAPTTNAGGGMQGVDVAALDPNNSVLPKTPATQASTISAKAAAEKKRREAELFKATQELAKATQARNLAKKNEDEAKRRMNKGG